MIIIYPHYDIKSGAGHYFRVLRLAYELKKNDEVIFILEKKNQIYYDKNFKHYYLKKNKDFVNKKKRTDALCRFLSKFSKKETKIIIDDYRIGLKEENKLKYLVNKVIIIDDFINKPHYCDFYINFKNLSIPEKLKLKKNIPNKCKKIIGSNFAIINPKLKIKKKITKNLNILFYAGGSGSMLFFSKIIKMILKDNDLKKKVKVFIYFGNNSNGVNYFKYLKDKNRNLNLIFDKNNLETYLNKADLYFGHPGNSIYENSYLKLISLLFPVSQNQINSCHELEKLGHYFIMKKKYINNIKLLDLIKKIINNIKSIRNNSFKNDSVNLKSPHLIAKIINKTEVSGNNLKDYNFSSTKRIKKSLGVKKIKFDEINNYLSARNLNFNSKLMLNKKKIGSLDHYNWWLDNEFKSRNTFIYRAEDEVKVYIWHKKIIIKNKSYLVGGWTTNNKNIKVTDVILSLKWQLNETKKLKATWLAVINKKNLFTLRLNKMLGFKLVIEKSYVEKLSKNYFGIKNKDYHILYYDYSS